MHHRLLFDCAIYNYESLVLFCDSAGGGVVVCIDADEDAVGDGCRNAGVDAGGDGRRTAGIDAGDAGDAGGDGCRNAGIDVGATGDAGGCAGRFSSML